MRLNREQIIERLKAHRDELRAAGVTHAALFGSVARGDEADQSDIDIAVEFPREFPLKGFRYLANRDRVEARLTEILERKVDLSDLATMRERVRAAYARERIRAF